MTKNDAQPKDKTRVTIRFRDETVADEFHRRAGEANKRPSPFAAQLIKQALTEQDAENYDQEMLRHELEELRNSVGVLRELPQKLSGHHASSDDVLAELAALRNELGELRDSVRLLQDLPEKLAEHQKTPTELLTKLQELQANVAQLAALPHVFRKLREDVATGVHVLLVRSGQLTRPESEEWIRQRLLEE